MNLMPPIHPPSDQLAQYSLGKLDDTQTAEIELHIAECQDCARTIIELPGGTLIDNLRHSTEEQPPAAQTLAPTPPLVSAAEQATLAPGAGLTKTAPQPSAAAMGLPAELTNHSRYQILERLGQGGMGSVYKAQHRMMNRLVALKIINPQLINHPGAAERFRREVQAAARLSHPNIVAAHDADEAGGLHFLVMEYVEGVDLHQVIQERGPLPAAEACEYIRQAALGLQHAHERGMVHRDIKPHNLMLTESGRLKAESGADGASPPAFGSPNSAFVKILDFGLASLAGDLVSEAAHHSPGEDIATPQLTMMGAMMGTPDYIAPEQATDAHTVDIRADIYSLGCTFYCLLTGQAPFHEGTVYEKIVAHAEAAPQLLLSFRKDVPPDVEQILQRMMAKDPVDRFQRPQDVADALAPWSAGSGATGPAAKATPPVTQPHRSWWIPAAGLLTALGAVAGAIVLGVVLYLRTQYGMVEIEINEPDITAQIDGQTITVQDAGEPIRITPGEHTLTVQRGELEFTTEKFVLGSGKNPALRVAYAPGKIAVHQGDRLLSERLLKEGTPQDLQSRAKPPYPRDSAAFILTSDEYEWTEPKNLGPQVNSKDGDGGPWVSVDGLTLLFSSHRTAGGDYDLWQCTRSSVDADWSEPVKLGEPINSRWFDAGAEMSADARTLVFVSIRPGGQGTMDLWMATRESADASWSAPVNLGPKINSMKIDTLPSLSDDGLQLIFSSNRGGRFELFITSRKSVNEAWPTAEPFSIAGNRGGRVQLLDAGETLLYAPNHLEIFLVSRSAAGEPWVHDVRLPAPINNVHRNGMAFFRRSSNTLYFESDRPGGQGKIDLWMSRRVKKGSAESQGEIVSNRKAEENHGANVRASAASPDGRQAINDGGAALVETSRSALAFDGDGDTVTLPPLFKDSNAEQLTVEAWLKFSDVATPWIQNVISGDYGAFIVGLPPHDQTWKCLVNKQEVRTDEPIDANRPMHVALVLDSKKASFYLDGRQIGETELRQPFDAASDSLTLGGSSWDTAKHDFAGNLYAVRFSQTARYTTSFIPQPRWEADSETLALYRFDEGEGDALKDASGNGHHGTIVGATWVRDEVAAADPVAPAPEQSSPAPRR